LPSFVFVVIKEVLNQQSQQKDANGQNDKKPFSGVILRLEGPSVCFQGRILSLKISGLSLKISDLSLEVSDLCLEGGDLCLQSFRLIFVLSTRSWSISFQLKPGPFFQLVCLALHL
jgi:hypothetical protein